jgi:hypothetical protein
MNTQDISFMSRLVSMSNEFVACYCGNYVVTAYGNQSILMSGIMYIKHNEN